MITITAPTDEPTEQPLPIGEPPRRTRAFEATIALAALVLNSWALSRNGYGNVYYAAAARSMTSSWHNFIYASYDAGGFITPDKPPFALWVQAVSAKIFGFSSWSLLLPSAIAGACSVWLLIVTVRRVWGRPAGLAAGIALALTPMMFAVSRSSNPDAILVLTLVAATWTAERAIATDRYRWSVIAGTVVGLGFLTKMLAAGIVLPAIAAAIVIGLRTRWRRSFTHLALIGACFAGVSGAWVALIDLSPNSPFVGGSTDGTAWNLVFGYNGFGRVFGAGVGGGAQGGPPRGFPGGGAGPFGSIGGIDQFGGQPGVGRLFNADMGDQVMWLSVIVGVTIIAGLVVAVRGRRRDARAGSIAMFSIWLIVGYLLFAFAEGIFHNYYVSAIAPALAALVGIGVALVLEGGRMARLIAAASVAATAAVQLILLRRVAAFEWLRVAVPVLLGLTALSLAIGAFRPKLDRWRSAIIVGGLASALLASAMWIGSGMGRAETATFPDARPATGVADGPGGLGQGGLGQGGFGQGGLGQGGLGPGATSIDTAVLDYLQANTTTEKWILAVRSSMEAGSSIVAGYPLLAMGGFSGGDPAMTADRLAGLVDGGELRYVSTGGGDSFAGGGGGGFGGAGNISTGNISTLVAAACAQVDLTGIGSAGNAPTIYDCRGKGEAILEAAKATPATGGGQAAPPADGGAGRPVSAELTTCLTGQGIDATVFGQGPPDFTDPKIGAAMQACMQYLPSGGPNGP